MLAPSPSRPRAARAPSTSEERPPAVRLSTSELCCGACPSHRPSPRARGRRSVWADLHNPRVSGPISTTPSTSVRRALPLGHVFVEATVRRGGMVSSGATLTLSQLRARKVVFFPLLIPQPDSLG